MGRYTIHRWRPEKNTETDEERGEAEIGYLADTHKVKGFLGMSFSRSYFLIRLHEAGRRLDSHECLLGIILTSPTTKPQQHRCGFVIAVF